MQLLLDLQKTLLLFLVDVIQKDCRDAKALFGVQLTSENLESEALLPSL